MNQTVICIAGAHRSGTSMLTRLLQNGGVYLGSEEDLMPAAADNPDGFWENLRFVQLNEEALNAVGAAWDLPPAKDETFSNSQCRPLQTKGELLIARFGDQATWGWKDPRNCLTLPFWRSLLPNFKVVIIVRNPLEVAYSMHRRNGTSYALGLRLWEIYNRRLLASTQPAGRVVTDYQSFFDRPEAELEKIAAFAELSSEKAVAAATLVTKDRRHTAFTTEQLIDAGVAEEIVALYSALIRESRGTAKTAPQDPASSGSHDFASVALTPLAGAASELNLAIPEGETIRGELAWRRGNEIAQREKVRQLQVRVETLRQEMAGKSERLALEIGRITELQAAYAHLDQLLLREQARREKMAEDLQNARERFGQTNRLLHNQSVQLAASEAASASLTQRLRRELGEMKRLVRLLNEIEDAADRLRTSRRWILINPFAWIAAKLSGKKLRGFGHLERCVAKYRTWRSAHAEVENLDDAIAQLRSPHSPVDRVTLEASQPIERKAKVVFRPPPPSKPISFPTHLDVEVSVIIPVYNQIDFTQACLASLQEHSDDIPFEVIVVDDCSTDTTAEILNGIPGLLYLPNDSNVGFIASCNQGAKSAHGRYLLFLNNDTIVTPGWMARLRETFDFAPDAGLVGSKLVYPDGRLQEAGGIIWRDASGWNRGKFQDAGKPEYNFLCEVDYCSAASVMIPKSLFVSLGGFDAKYAPAYYEDVDLAFKIRAAGRRVLYQPLSTVIHYEGITSGTDTSAGAKKHQVSNRATFATAWETVLADKPVNGDVTALEASHPEKRRILVIDHHLPMTDRDAGSVRMFHILTLLRDLGHKVTFLPDNLGDIPPYGDDIRKRGIEFVHHPYCKSVRSYLETHGPSLDVVILSRCDFARKHIAATREFAPQSRIIFDTVDLHHLRLSREAELTKDPVIEATAVEKERQEFELIDEADETWVVSHYEQQLLEAKRPLRSIEVVPTIVEVPGSKTSFSLRHDFLFIGGFQHSPNADAVIYFAQEVFPSILRQFPGIRFYVIGDKAPPSVIALASENIIITGLQPDVRPYFESVRLSVAPLRFGAGVKGKINQSMAFGVPVVATSLAVEGMSLTNGIDIVLADNPEEFAQAVIRLYEDVHLWEKLSQNGLRTTAEAYSPQAVRKQLSRLLSDDHLSRDKLQTPVAMESVHRQGLEPGVAA